MIYMYTIINKVFFSVRLFVLCFFKVIVFSRYRRVHFACPPDVEKQPKHYSYPIS